MTKHVLQEPKGKPTTDKIVDPTAVRADLLAHGSHTREHIDPATGWVPEADYSNTGWDRMDEDVIARQNDVTAHQKK